TSVPYPLPSDKASDYNNSSIGLYPLPSDKASDYNNSSIGLYPLPSVSTDGSLVSTGRSFVSINVSLKRTAMDKVLNPQAATSVPYPLPSDKASDYNNSSIGLYPLPSVSTGR
ncbi:MAG: hypothetical protein PHG29_04660, partial [Prolixibacteraceae bacterium]|nr:hypothetical protein [Prolixibacteraceae bacterium]